MRNLVVIIIILLVISALGGITYKYYQKNKNTPAVTPTIAQKTLNGDIIVPLTAQNNSGETGQAVLTEMNGKVRVKITLDNPPKDVSQPAHIHLGKCPNPDAVKYPLLNVENGSSTTTLDASMNDLIKNVPLAINVHKSGTDVKTYVSCGDIKFEAQL